MKKLIGLLKKFFTNDWMSVKVYTKNWANTFSFNGHKIEGLESKEKTLFIIKYSRKKNKFKICVEGELNEITKPMYIDTLNKVNSLNIELLNGVNIKHILDELS